MTTPFPVPSEAADAALAADDVIERVRREVAAVNAPESWKARAEAAEAKLARIAELADTLAPEDIRRIISGTK